jgi:glutamine amidotransferase
MDALKRKGLDDFLKTTEKPFLGICVGMQVLFDYLEEDDCPGLGIISGKVIRFDPQKVGIIPHMGWNQVNSQFSILNSQFSTDDFYFVHSYYCVPKNAAHCIATTDYSQQRFCSSVAKANFYGMQFHPEKSGLAGEKILQWFCIRK